MVKDGMLKQHSHLLNAYMENIVCLEKWENISKEIIAKA